MHSSVLRVCIKSREILHPERATGVACAVEIRATTGPTYAYVRPSQVFVASAQFSGNTGLEAHRKGELRTPSECKGDARKASENMLLEGEEGTARHSHLTASMFV